LDTSQEKDFVPVVMHTFSTGVNSKEKNDLCVLFILANRKTGNPTMKPKPVK
jgi:hypothetical protein